MERRAAAAPPTATLTVRSFTHATPRTRLLCLDLGDTSLAFVAGQAMMLGRHGQRLRKPYSIACAPEDAARTRGLEFLVGLDAHGSAGSHLDGTSHRGLVDLEGPFGRFRVPEHVTERRFLFVGGGTGIAPLRAMVRHVIARRPRVAVAVVYCARTSDELAYRQELRQLAREGRIELTLTVTREPHDSPWKGERGRIGRRHLAPHVAHAETLCFLCGPQAFVEHLVPALTELGVTRKRILKEDWSRVTFP